MGGRAPPAGGAELSAGAGAPARPRPAAAAGGAWALLALAVGLAHGAGRSLVAAHLIGAREMGMFGIAMLALATVDALTTSAAETALVTHPGDPEADLDPTFTLRLAQGALGAALLWAGAPWVARFFGGGADEGLIRALAAVPLLRGLSNPAAILLVRRTEFRRLFWWGLPEALAGTALVVAVGLWRGDAWALAAAAIGGQAVSTGASYALAPRVPRLSLRGGGMRRLLHYGRWMQGTRVLMFLGLYLDNAVVGRLLGATALGLYQIAFRVGELCVTTLGQAAAQVLLPVLVRLRPSPEAMRREYLRGLRGVMAASGACALGAGLLVRPAVARTLGPEWLPAVPAAQLLLAAMVLRNVMLVSNQLLYALERPRLVFATNAARVAAMALALVPLVPRFGIAGVAGAVLVSCLAGAVGSAAAVRASLRDAGAPRGPARPEGVAAPLEPV